MQYRDEKTKLFARTVGLAIKDLRLKKKYSINKLANEYDLDVGNTSRIENGITEVKLVTIWKLAEALNTQPSKIIQTVEEELGKNFHFYEE